MHKNQFRSKRKLIHYLNDIAKKNNRKPTKKDISPEILELCEKWFGSWRKTLSHINTKNYIQNYTREDILEAVKNKAIELNRNPVKTDLELKYQILIYKYFGSFNNLLKELNLIPNSDRANSYTTEYLKNGLLRWSEENNKIPTISDIQFMENMPKGLATYKKVFNIDKWTDILRQVGLDPKKCNPIAKDTDEELIQKYINFSNKIGRLATLKDLDESNEMYNSKVFYRRFGSLTNLRKLAGFNTKEPPQYRYTKEELMNKLIYFYIHNDYRKLTISEINENKNLPITQTIIAYFKVKTMSQVWDEIIDIVKSGIDVKKGNAWSDEEEMFLKIYYKKVPSEVLAIRLQRTYKSVEQKAYKMKLKKEDDYLSEYRYIKQNSILIDGYEYVRVLNHPFANKKGYVKKSRLVMEEKLGRYLTKHEKVIHINGFKFDVRSENLKIVTKNKMENKDDNK